MPMPEPSQDQLLHAAISNQLSREEQLAAVDAAAKQYYYTPEQEFDDLNKQMVIDEMRAFVRPGRILELGYTNDIWTKALLEFGTVDVIEGAATHVERGRRDFGADNRVRI